MKIDGQAFWFRNLLQNWLSYFRLKDLGTRWVWSGWSQFGKISIRRPGFSEVVQVKPSQLQIPVNIVSGAVAPALLSVMI